MSLMSTGTTTRTRHGAYTTTYNHRLLLEWGRYQYEEVMFLPCIAGYTKRYGVRQRTALTRGRPPRVMMLVLRRHIGGKEWNWNSKGSFVILYTTRWWICIIIPPERHCFNTLTHRRTIQTMHLSSRAQSAQRSCPYLPQSDQLVRHFKA
jgi:hypothetical protein